MDYFAKKQWIRIAVCAVLVAVAALAVTGVFGGKGPLLYPSTVAVTKEATEQGFGGDVTVHATLEDDKISALSIDTPNETEGLGKRASEAEFTEQFIGKAGPFTFGEDGIEALSGATVTSNAALKALNTIVSGGEEAAEEPAEETAANTEETPAEEKAEEKAEKPAAQEETKQESASGGQEYGVYRSVKENAFSTVTVIASAKNGELTDVKILSEGEEGKDLLTDEIKADWAKAILESGSASPDAITGATLTFSAGSVQEAMTEILAEISGGETETAAEPEAAEEKPAEEPAAQEEAKQETASDGQEYGVYRAASQNDFSTVTVIASAKNGKLTDVKILSEGEEGKDLLTDEIKAEWAKAILESGSASPDAITGATLKFSAASVQEAMTEIIAEMNGEATAPETAEEPAVEPAEKTTEEPAAEAAEAPAEEPVAETAEEPTEEPAAEPAEEPTVETPVKTYPAYAGYRAEAKNDFSTVTVIASAKNGKLTGVKILSEGEKGKDLLTDEIKAEWAKAILESGSAAPDAVTGATLKFSAASVQEAATEILAKMDGEAETPEAAEEPAAEPAEEPAAEPAEAPAAEDAGEAAPETAEEPAAEAPAKTYPAYAGYRAEAENQFSKVIVIAFAKNGKLASVKILSEGEDGKDLLTDEIKAEWAKAILESGSAAPDAMTGATLKFSAGSVQEAMEKILAAMEGN